MNNENGLDNASFRYGVLTQGIWLKVGLLSTTFLIVYSDTILLFVRTWLGRDNYSHGFLIPFISLYFVWRKRASLSYVPIQPSILSGLLVTLAGGLMLIMGKVSGTAVIQQVSILVFIPGLVLMLLGGNFLKVLALPLSYLILMVPILDLVIDRIHWPFQLFSATVAAGLLRIVNIPVLQNANYIELPNITLEVANACSGVRYLLSIMAIGIPLAFLALRTWRRRALLVLSAVVVGILANPVRITLAGIWAYYGGRDVHGPFHIFQGLFVLGVGFVFLFAMAWILKKLPSTNIIGGEASCLLLKGKKAGNDIISKHFDRAWSVAMATLIVVGFIIYLCNPSPVFLRSSLNKLPLRIGDWRGEDIDDHARRFPVKGADLEIVRTYRNPSGREVKFQVAYFESQQQDKKLIHDKFSMLDDIEPISINMLSKDEIHVNKAMFIDGNESSLVLFWYDLNGRIIADKYFAKFVTVFDGTIRGRTNGALILVSSNVIHACDMQTILNEEIEFVKLVLPVLNEYIP